MVAYKILLVGNSGNGKTYSFRNLDKEKTAFVNAENKPLPFKGLFKYQTNCVGPDGKSSHQKLLADLVVYAQNPDITCIVIDSFSAYSDMVKSFCKATFKGFDVWSNYNSEISKFLDLVKRINKEVIITAHPEYLQDEGLMVKRVKVAAKEWEGVIEKEFSIVLFADKKIDINTKKVSATFNLVENNTSAKCPPDIFGEDVYSIPNDCNFILQKIEDFKK